MNKAIKYIEDNNILNESGIIICEYEEESPICNYKLIKEKKFGKTNIKIFKKEDNEFQDIINKKLLEAEYEMNNTYKRYTLEEVKDSMYDILNK